MTSKTSYGLVTYNIIKELEKAGYNPAFFPIGGQNTKEAVPAHITKAIDRASIFSNTAPSLRIAHQFDMAESIGKGKRIGFTIFEMDSFTEYEKHQLRSLDKLIVPSKWAAGVCSSNKMSDVSVVNLGYDPEIFKPVDYRPPKCVFLSMGKWEVRKQQDQIVEAFNGAFKDGDSVELWMSFDNAFLDPKFIQEKARVYKSTKLGDKIKILPKVETQQEVARIMQQAHCFVAPSLAEGWNLELLEVMACGKETIATNYSGHTEFISANTTFLLEPKGLVKAEDGMWFNRSTKSNCGSWCQYNEGDLIWHMSGVYHMFCSKTSFSNKKIIDHASKFTWANCVRQLITAIGEN